MIAIKTQIASCVVQINISQPRKSLTDKDFYVNTHPTEIMAHFLAPTQVDCGVRKQYVRKNKTLIKHTN